MDYFPTELQKFQYYDKYARFDWDKGRRENWEETVTRAVDYLYELGGDRVDAEIYQQIRQNILELKIMPSMRLMAMAGPAAKRNNLCIYNCSFTAIRDVRAFDEILLLSMCGCGVGFSVEKKFTEQLPKLPKQIRLTGAKFVIPDTTEGWQEAIRFLFYSIFENSEFPDFDYSQIRPTGYPLKVKGGQASGPEIFKKTIDFIQSLIWHSSFAKNERLTPIQIHDIACSLGNAAVSGGIRRTAMISIFDIDDQEMMLAKSGKYNSFRWNANNSVVYNGHLTHKEFLNHMSVLFEEDNGEPCIFSLKNARNLAPERRKADLIMGVNPCGEINLRDCEMCNLSSAIAREDDTLLTLKEKVKLATVIGTLQSLATYFPGLRPEWKSNCEEERLLGVDITGQMDCSLIIKDVSALDLLKKEAIETNKVYAEKLRINQSASVTCVKPSGNSSQLVNCSSGLNPRWSKYYRRNVRVSVNSPVYKVLLASDIPVVPENGQTFENMTTAVVDFPVKSPDHALTKDDLTLRERLDIWKRNKLFYTEHNPSVTITYKPDEIMTLVNWIWDNIDVIGGLTFLPETTDKYDNMPYEEITEAEYLKLSADFPTIKWELLPEFEHTDLTTVAQEVACIGGSCDL